MRSRASLLRIGLPVVIGAVACVGFARSGVFAPFFLMPVALSFYRFGSATAWTTAVAAVLANAAFSAFSVMTATVPLRGFLADSSYFAAVSFGFVWAMSPVGLGGKPRVRFAYRLLASAILSALATIPVFLVARTDEGLVSLLRHQAEGFAKAFADAAGADVVERSIIERSLNADSILAAMSDAYLRGAAVVSHAAFFFATWRFSALIASARDPSLRRRRSFAAFRLEAFLIWPLIAAFAVVLVSLILNVVPLEILGWNVLSLCLLLYAAQGFGIIQYHLARPGVPRSIGPLVTILVALVLLRPGINAVLAGGIAALGIAENWLPLRAPIQTEPPSTPGA